MVRVLSLLLAVGCVVGCDEGPPDTCGVDNASLSLVAVVVDNGQKVRAEIDFESGDRATVPNPLRVCAEETLTIEGETPTITTKADRVVYSVTLPIDTPRDVAFRLQRMEGEPVEVTVPLPPPFTLTAPANGDEIARSEDLVLTWEPAVEGGEMNVGVQEDVGYGLCVVTQEGEHHYKTRAGVAVPDTGQWTIPAGAVTSQTPAPCRAFYNLRRVQRAAYPTSLSDGGFLEARVLRTVEILSVP